MLKFSMKNYYLSGVLETPLVNAMNFHITFFLVGVHRRNTHLPPVDLYLFYCIILKCIYTEVKLTPNKSLYKIITFMKRTCW